MNHGYTNVMKMQYGMDRWLQKGFPTKGNTYTTPIQSVDSCILLVVPRPLAMEVLAIR